MAKKSRKDMLLSIRKAHMKAYENLLKIMNEDLEENDEGKLKLSDDKIKAYADGIYKSSNTLELLVDKVKKIDLQLEEIDGDVSQKKEESKQGHGMNAHLK